MIGGSIYKLLSSRFNSRRFIGTISRGIAQQRSTMEEYFKDKRFIVTGASAGEYDCINFKLDV